MFLIRPANGANSVIFVLMEVSVDEWLKNRSEWLLLDVRTPAEYEQGHIPGALNLPLFDNEERARVGTLYVQQSREKAVDEGLRIVGPRLLRYVKRARKMAGGKPICLYCWRGGMRSGSMEWLLATAGMDVRRIGGGYKAYRNHLDELLNEKPWQFIILGGPTGSGKTPILYELQKQGEQIIDFEGLAHHKGSAFGALGQEPQPSTEHFINLVHDELCALDPYKRVWMESESKLIGKVFIPDLLWTKMLTFPIIRINLPPDVRAEHIAKEYGIFETEKLIEPFERIVKRLGMAEKQRAIEALQQNDIRTAVRIALVYYDKAYNKSLEKDWGTPLLSLPIEEDNPTETACLILKELDKLNK